MWNLIFAFTCWFWFYFMDPMYVPRDLGIQVWSAMSLYSLLFCFDFLFLVSGSVQMDEPEVYDLCLLNFIIGSWSFSCAHDMSGNETSFACARSCPCFTIVPGPWFCIYMDISFMICISDFFCPTPWLTSTLSPVHHDEHACRGLTWLWCG